MFFLRRLFVAAGAALAVLLPVLTLGGLCGSQLGLDLAALRELRDTFDRELARGREMDDEHRLVGDRLPWRHRIADDLLAGRMCLREAATCLHDMDRDRADLYRERLHLYYDGATDGERYCRQAIALAKMRAPEGPQREAAGRRLEEELRTLRERGAFTEAADRKPLLSDASQKRSAGTLLRSVAQQ